VAATAGARTVLAPAADAQRPLRELAFLPDGRVLRAVSMGQRHALADYYWLALIQHIGAAADAKAPRWDAVFPVANLVTDLDPRYGYAYQEAGGVLSGLAGRVDLSNKILLKGLEAVPDRWQLYWNLGFNKYFYEGDLAAAARYFQQAAEIGKRPHLAFKVSALALDAGGPEGYALAIHALEVALQEPDADPLREHLEHRLLQARTFQVLARVEQAAEAFRATAGRWPLGVSELVVSGRLPAVPPDPAGGAIELDPSTGKARSTVLGPRVPILNGQTP
jgi:tetratricopeptide (TPR) repeat protein